VCDRIDARLNSVLCDSPALQGVSHLNAFD
jgi:hypothetical protein